MPGPPERSPSGTILDLFDGHEYEPFTAREVAAETGYQLGTVRDELRALVDRGLLETKEVAGDRRVWWPTLHEQENGGGSGPSVQSADAAGGPETRAARQRLTEQHRRLAQFVTRVDITVDLDGILRQITEEARELVGAHQSVTSRTVNQNWEQAINAVSLSEKYAEYRDYDTRPDGSGIYSLVCERNQPMRMTQADLEAHPAWEAFGDEVDEHPPMEGWLAVPIVGPDGRNMGLIQLSDKYHGDFTEADEAILVQLANVAAAAIENARLYDELLESEERYRTLFESMTEGYCVVEAVDTGPGEPADFRYVEANPAFAAHSGLDDVVGRTVREVVPGAPEEWLDVLEDVAETSEGVEFERELEPAGRVLQCRAFPIGDAPDGQVGVTVQDVTERVERERDLKLFRTLLDRSTDAVFVEDPETGRLLDANETATRHLGYSREELLELTIPDIETELPTREAYRTFVERLRAEEQLTFDGVHQRKDGSTFPVEVNASYVDLDREYVIAVSRDVTERKERERRLQEAIQRLRESNERLEQFAYAASHDLQEPLRMVSSYLQLLERRYVDELDDEAEEYLGFAVGGADRMRAMIEGLLTYSRVEMQGEPLEPVDLNDVVAAVRDDLQVKLAESGADLSVETLPRVEGDASQLRQVFQNLLENAIEYSGDEPPRIQIEAEREGSEWVVSVRDHGIGIDSDDTDRIFRVFERLHGRDEHPGTGIGLALCERIVERHAGDIWVESEPGDGSAFSFTLPAGDP